MPPTQKSTSTRSAHNESDAIGIQDVYYLSDYAFQIQRNSVASSTYDQITAVCTYKDGKNARQAIQVPSSTQLDGWYVEANETEATVYSVVRVQEGGSEYSSDLDTSPTVQPIPTGSVFALFRRIDQVAYPDVQKIMISGNGTAFGTIGGSGSFTAIIASDSPGSATMTIINTNPYSGKSHQTVNEASLNNSFTHNGKTVYYNETSISYTGPVILAELSPLAGRKGNSDYIAWTMIYGNSSGGEYKTEEIVVGRFAIDIEDAGGDGPGSDWDDPGDWNEDWEEGDPTQTLHVEVVGALSGRHNDPIEDPSFSYIPADKETVKGYGCGGDGGHGGGGGAGASTVVVHKFATNQADSKEITALARRHGYGSGGGKGGKGGDGCILVYY